MEAQAGFDRHDQSVETAVILAAGMGTRLPPVDEPLPKGLIDVGGESLLDRSLGLLRQHGITRIVLVTGFQGDRLVARFGGLPGVEFVHSADYHSTESFWSLKLALDVVDEPFWLLECDLFYDASFLGELQSCDASDAILISTATCSGDEVWASSREDCVARLSKDRRDLDNIRGEIVGISKFSRASRDALTAIFDRMTEPQRRAATYDGSALNHLFPLRPIRIVPVCGQKWGEIDDAGHYRRVVEQVLPAVAGIPA